LVLLKVDCYVLASDGKKQIKDEARYQTKECHRESLFLESRILFLFFATFFHDNLSMA